MKVLKQYLRKISIKQRLLFGFILLPLVVLIICFISYYNFSVQVMLTKNKETSTQSVTMAEEILHLSTKQVEEQLHSFIQRQEVDAFLRDPHNSEKKQLMHQTVRNINGLGDKGKLILYNVAGTVVFQEQDKANIPYPNTVETQTAPLMWSYSKEDDVILVSAKIINSKQHIGYVTLSFPTDAFSSTFTNSAQGNPMLVVVNAKDEYLFGQAKFKKGTIIDTSNDSIDINGKKYYQVVKPITDMNWKVINLVHENYVLEEMHNFRNILLIYGLGIALIEMMLATLVFNSIYEPIWNVLKAMRGLDETNLKESKVLDIGKDEVHELSDNYNDLVDRLAEVLKTVEIEQEQKRETQIQLLQAQINPHFLFNTLNTLHYLAILNEDNPVSEGIQALSKLLRNTIVDSNEYVAVDDEIENVKNYVIIQKLRYGDVFETVYNVDEEVRQCQIMKFLLQPIVENSILHAFEEDEEHQILTIRAKKEDIYLKIEIGDNGKGFSMNEGLPGKTRLSGIGIANIQERIRLMYGDKYSMTIQSELHKGTIVTLLLPYKKGAV